MRQAVQACINTWWDAYNSIQSINRKIVDNVLGAYDEFIAYADDFDMWSSLDFSKIDYLKKKLAEVNRLFEQGVLTLQEYNDLLRQIGLDIYQEQKDTLTEIIELTMKLVKQETEDKVKGLEAQIDAFKKIIELKKKSLAASWDEENYQKEVAKRVKAIAELQAKISQLERDDSRAAQAEKANLLEEMAELQEELADYQAKYSYEAQLDALDKEADAHDKTKNEEIQVLKETIDMSEKLYEAAIARIDAGWNQLYQDLMEWNSKYGDMIDGPDSITSAWQTAKAAAEEYGGVIQALSAIKSEIYTMQGTSSASQSYGNTQGSSNTSSSNSSSNKQAQIDSILSQMKANASKWGSANESYRKSLEAANEALAAQLSVLMGRSVVKDYANGIWYLDYIGGTRLYHIGLEQGYVGADTPNKDEVLAVLQKGELVMTKDQYTKIFNSLTSGGHGVLDALTANITGSSRSVSDMVASITNNNTNNNTEDSIILEPHFHTDSTLTEEKMKQFADMYAEHTIDRLNSATRRVGIKNSLGNSMLRG